MGSCPKTTEGTQYMLVNTDQNSRLTQAIPTFNTTASYLANFFFGLWLIPYGNPRYLLAENGFYLVKHFFAMMCALLVDKHLAATV